MSSARGRLSVAFGISALDNHPQMTADRARTAIGRIRNIRPRHPRTDVLEPRVEHAMPRLRRTTAREITHGHSGHDRATSEKTRDSSLGGKTIDLAWTLDDRASTTGSRAHSSAFETPVFKDGRPRSALSARTRVPHSAE